MRIRTLRKTFENNLFEPPELTDHEIAAALRALRLRSPLQKKDQALKVLAALRQEVAANPAKYSRTS